VSVLGPIRPPVIPPVIAPIGGGLAWDSSGGGAVFDPTQVPGRLLDLWVDPANYTITGAGASSWRDLIGAHDFVQGTDALRPTLVASWRNGKPALEFNGTSQRMSKTFTADQLLAASTDYTLYMFGELDTINGGAVDNVVIDFANGAMMHLLGTDSFVAGWNDGGYRSTGAPSTGAHCWVWACDSGVASGSNVYQDGVSLGTATVTGNGLGGATFVGSTPDPVAFFDGKMARIIIYSGLHDATTRNAIVGWGRTYYGLP
jgi:hypothetical protein